MLNISYRIPVGSATITDVTPLPGQLLKISFTDQIGQASINISSDTQPSPKVGYKLSWDGNPVIERGGSMNLSRCINESVS